MNQIRAKPAKEVVITVAAVYDVITITARDKVIPVSATNVVITSFTAQKVICLLYTSPSPRDS